MSKLSEKKSSVKGSIAALQTVLERYPVLLTANNDATETSFDFILNLLRLFGIEEDEILNWLSNILTNSPDGTSGILFAIEAAIKTIIIGTFKDTYTSSINPILPDNVMMSFNSKTGWERGEGIEIALNDIDAFGLLRYTPTDTKTSVFYFDTDKNKDYDPSNVYSSMDFNAFLWYCINKGNFWADSQKLKCVWDNRVWYYKKFAKSGCLTGNAVNDETTPKGAFFKTDTLNSPTMMVKDVGPKQEILACEYREKLSASGEDTRTIRVYLNAGRYKNTSITGMQNKTIFEFNFDYVNSLKLFDTKTLVAQIINSVLGISSSIPINLSLEQIIYTKKVEQIVREIIYADDNEQDTSSNRFFTFSNEEYNSMMEEAELSYNGKYQSGNENRDLIDIDSDAILDEIYKISETEDIEERKNTVSSTFKNIASIIASTKETPSKDKFNFQENIITKFLNETIVQLCLQILSPKIMLLYAINEKIMNPDEQGSAGLISFMKNFRNLIVSMVKQIKNIILQQLFDFLIGQIKPILTLFVQKLLLETIYYYKILIEALITSCSISGVPRFTNQVLVTDTITHADIIPREETPPTEEDIIG